MKWRMDEVVRGLAARWPQLLKATTRVPHQRRQLAPHEMQAWTSERRARQQSEPRHWSDLAAKAEVGMSKNTADSAIDHARFAASERHTHSAMIDRDKRSDYREAATWGALEAAKRAGHPHAAKWQGEIPALEHARSEYAKLPDPVDEFKHVQSPAKQELAHTHRALLGEAVDHRKHPTAINLDEFDHHLQRRNHLVSQLRSVAKGARHSDEHFSPDAMDRAVRQTGMKSRHALVRMPISHFLSLAKPGHSQDKEDGVESALSAGHKFADVPHMGLDESGPDSKVVSHDGRHRARALQKRGYTHMPVLVTSSHTRWSEQKSSNNYDYRHSWPKSVVSEDGSKTMAYPLTRSGEYTG